MRKENKNLEFVQGKNLEILEGKKGRSGIRRSFYFLLGKILRVFNLFDMIWDIEQFVSVVAPVYNNNSNPHAVSKQENQSVKVNKTTRTKLTDLGMK